MLKHSLFFLWAVVFCTPIFSQVNIEWSNEIVSSYQSGDFPAPAQTNAGNLLVAYTDDSSSELMMPALAILDSNQGTLLNSNTYSFVPAGNLGDGYIQDLEVNGSNACSGIYRRL